jgi:hypothetical protein
MIHRQRPLLEDAAEERTSRRMRARRAQQAPSQVRRSQARALTEDLDLPLVPTAVSGPDDVPFSGASGADGPPPSETKTGDRPRLSLVPASESDAIAPTPVDHLLAGKKLPLQRRSAALTREPVTVAAPETSIVKPMTIDPRRPQTGVFLAHMALPPATDFEQPLVRLRRDQSVIADAVAARNGLWKMQSLAKRATTDLASALSTIGYLAGRAVTNSSVAAIRRFESMPRKRQIMWVSLPYLVVGCLVLLLLQLREVPAQATVIVAAPEAQIETHHALDAPLTQAPIPAPAPKGSDVLKAALGSATDKPIPAPRSITRPESVHVPISSSLRVKPDAGSAKVARLKANARVYVYRDFPTNDGWVLAQRPSGEIGFLIASHLEGKKEPRFEKDRTKPRAHAKPKFDPINELLKPPRSQRGRRS